MNNSAYTSDPVNLSKSKKTGKRRWLMQFLVMLLGMLVMLLVWLFYPVEPSPVALRALLPQDCGICIETHQPAKLWEDWNRQKYLQQIVRLPAWKLVAEKIRRQTGQVVDEAKVETFINGVDAGLGQVPFAGKSLLALAVGVFQDNRGELVQIALAEVDNLGWAVAKLWLKFSPSGRVDGMPYASIPVKISGVGAVYFTCIPGGRRIAITAKKPENLLTLIGGGGFDVLKSSYKKGHHTPIELSLQWDDDLDRVMGNSRVLALSDGTRVRVESLGSDIVLDLGDVANRTVVKLSPQGKLNLQPLETAPLGQAQGRKGLFVNLSERNNTALRFLKPELKKSAPQYVQNFVEQSVLPHYRRNFFLSLAQSEKDMETADFAELLKYSCLGWSVDDFPSAVKMVSSGARQLLDTLRRMYGQDPMVSYMLNSVRISHYNKGRMLVLPQGDPGVNPVWGGWTGDAKPDNQAILLSVAKLEPTVFSPVDQKVPADLNLRGTLLWDYAPLVVRGLAEFAVELQKIDALVASDDPKGQAGLRNLVTAMQNISLILGSLENLQASVNVSGEGGWLRVDLNMDGKLRLGAREASGRQVVEK